MSKQHTVERGSVHVSQKFKILLRAYETAFWNDVEKAGEEPESWRDIEDELSRRTRELLRYVATLECNLRPYDGVHLMQRSSVVRRAKTLVQDWMKKHLFNKEEALVQMQADLYTLRTRKDYPMIDDVLSQVDPEPFNSDFLVRMMMVTVACGHLLKHREPLLLRIREKLVAALGEDQAEERLLGLSCRE